MTGPSVKQDADSRLTPHRLGDTWFQISNPRLSGSAKIQIKPRRKSAWPLARAKPATETKSPAAFAGLIASIFKYTISTDKRNAFALSVQNHTQEP
jgi:hypothetical protein